MNFPYGLLVDAIVIILGALIGIKFGKYISEQIKATLTCIFGLICFALGITLIVGVHALVPVALALIIGTAIGEILNLENRISSLLNKVQNKLSGESGQDKVNGVLTLVPLFCFSTTIIVGGMNEAFGEHEMLFVKSVLDFFTALIFAANYGMLVGFLCVPMFFVGMFFYTLSSALIPIMTPSVIADMNATGGIHCVACALGVLGIKKLNVNNMAVALLLSIPISILWSLIT